MSQGRRLGHTSPSSAVRSDLGNGSVHQLPVTQGWKIAEPSTTEGREGLRRDVLKCRDGSNQQLRPPGGEKLT